jgi:hypothetical protein
LAAAEKPEIKIIDRIIVSVQFPDLMDTLTKALLENSITCAAITGKNNIATLSREDQMLLEFQKHNGQIEVLLLNSAKDSAAGQ